MDKAYDAESIHRFIVEDLKAEALIPARNSSRMSYPDYTEAEHMTVYIRRRGSRVSPCITGGGDPPYV